MNNHRLGAAGLAIIKFYEQLRLRAYLPTADDIPTIGWGHTKGVMLGDTCTQEQADQWLLEDCAEAVAAVNQLVEVPITTNQFDALVSLVFNIGTGAFMRSTLLRKLNSHDYYGAALEFSRWNKQAGRELPGLTARRAIEAELFLNVPEYP